MSTAVATRTNRLTDRHHLFVSRIITNGGNAADAAEFAGFAKPYDRSGWRLLQRVEIRREIELRKAEFKQAEKLTPEDVMAGLAKEARNADTASARVSAWRTLADILGMTQGNARELPDALNAMLEAVARGLAAGSKQASLPAGQQAIESSMREVADLNEDEGKQDS